MKTERRSKQTVGQAANETASTAQEFSEYLRGAVRGALWELMQEEVEVLCGPKHRPWQKATHRRAGSEEGVFYFETRKEALKRLRVRQRQGGGWEREVPLSQLSASPTAKEHRGAGGGVGRGRLKHTQLPAAHAGGDE